jgi:hypothetical protein
MKQEKSEDGRQERDQQDVADRLAPLSVRARNGIESATNRLWLGNAGGAAATMTYVNGSGNVRHILPYPIVLFLIGLIALGLGSACELCQVRSKLVANQMATNVQSLKADVFEYPSASAGFRPVFLATSIAAAIFFVLGCVAGIWELLV